MLGERDLGVALGGAFGQLDHVVLGEVAQEFAEGAEPVVGLVEGRVLPEQGSLERRGVDRAAGTALKTGHVLGDEGGERVEVGGGRVRGRLGLGFRLCRLRLGFGGSGRTAAPGACRRDLDTFQAVVVEELVARGG